MNTNYKSKITAARRAEVVERRLKGETSSELAEIFGITSGYVDKLVRMEGHSLAPPPKISDSDAREMLGRFEDGETVGDLARAFGVHYDTARRAIAKARLLPPEEESEVDEYNLKWVMNSACKGMDPEFFEYEPDRDERLADAVARYELAKEVCIKCPTSVDCLDSANEDDRLWTTRGGLMPLGLRRRLKAD